MIPGGAVGMPIEPPIDGGDEVIAGCDRCGIDGICGTGGDGRLFDAPSGGNAGAALGICGMLGRAGARACGIAGIAG